jgi:hypothetical protein
MTPRPIPWTPTLAVLLFVALSVVAYRYWLVPLSHEVVLLDLVAREEAWQRRLDEEARRRERERTIAAVRRDVARAEDWLEAALPSSLDPAATLETAKGWAAEEGLEVVAAEAGPIERSDLFSSSVLGISLHGDPDAARRWLGRVAEELALAELEELSVELRGGAPSGSLAGDPEPPAVDLRARLRIYGDPGESGE